MKKFLIGGVLALAMLVSPLAASAATISNPLFSNGDTTIDAAGGSTVNGTFALQVGSNEVCEVLRTQASTQAFTDTSVGGTLGYQQGTYTNVPFSVKVSPNTGTYNVTAQCAGIWGGNRSIDGSDNVVVGPVSLGNVRVTSSGSTGSTADTSFQAQINALAAQIAALVAAMHPTAPAPATGACATLNAKLVGTVDNTYNDANVRLQGFLLSEGASIPALAAGASFGFKGPQTRAAVSTFVMTHNCN